MMKKYKMLSFLISIILLAYGCDSSRRSKELSKDTSGTSQSASPSLSVSQSPYYQGRKKTLQDRYDATQRMIEHASARAKITNLRDKPLSNSETEIRIWVGFGLAIPRCFVLRSVNERS